MSLRWMIWAFDQVVGSHSRKLILVKLADNANDDGVCWPSLATIARQCEVDRSTAIRQIAKLEEAFYLKRIPRFDNGSQKSNQFVLAPNSWLPDVSPRNPPQSQFATPPGGKLPPAQSQSATPPGSTAPPRTNHHESFIQPPPQQPAGSNDSGRCGLRFPSRFPPSLKSAVEEKLGNLPHLQEALDEWASAEAQSHNIRDHVAWLAKVARNYHPTLGGQRRGEWRKASADG